MATVSRGSIAMASSNDFSDTAVGGGGTVTLASPAANQYAIVQISQVTTGGTPTVTWKVGGKTILVSNATFAGLQEIYVGPSSTLTAQVTTGTGADTSLVSASGVVFVNT